MPRHLPDASRDAKELGHGEGYGTQVEGRLARWREAQPQAQGIEQTEELPARSDAEVLDVKRRAMRRGVGAPGSLQLFAIASARE